jgi:hypothetical protein
MHGLPAAIRRHPWLAALWLIAALAAAVQLGRLGIFMLDADRAALSVLPGRKFFREHSCLTSFTEAARFAREGGRNVYDPREYMAAGCGDDLMKCGERFIGPLTVDLYQYPATFLLLPTLARAVTHDFLLIRTGWFVLQVGLLLAATLLLARWIGGTAGAAAAALSVALWMSPSTLVGIQLGNFQATAYALSVLGMIALSTGRFAIGGAAVGFAAASKLFPGVLFVYLAAARRWRAAGWIAAGAALSTIAALALVGTRPFVDFVQYQMPRLNSGEAFFWIDVPPIAPINYGVYGLLGRLRALGAIEFTRDTGAFVSTMYGGVLFLATIAAGLASSSVGSRSPKGLDYSSSSSPKGLDYGRSLWTVVVQPFRAASPATMERLRAAQLWLALLNLGSFRSPFVPDAYALMGTTWLLTLVAAGWTRLTAARALFFAAAVAMFALVFDGLWPADPPRWAVVLTLGNQLLALGLNAWVLARAIRSIAAAPAPLRESSIL